MSAARQMALSRAEPFGWALELDRATGILDAPPHGQAVVDPASSLPGTAERRYFTFAGGGVILALPAPVQIAAVERAVEPLPEFLAGLESQGAAGLLWRNGAVYLVVDPHLLRAPAAARPSSPGS